MLLDTRTRGDQLGFPLFAEHTEEIKRLTKIAAEGLPPLAMNLPALKSAGGLAGYVDALYLRMAQEVPHEQLPSHSVLNAYVGLMRDVASIEHDMRELRRLKPKMIEAARTLRTISDLRLVQMKPYGRNLLWLTELLERSSEGDFFSNELRRSRGRQQNKEFRSLVLLAAAVFSHTHGRKAGVTGKNTDSGTKRSGTFVDFVESLIEAIEASTRPQPRRWWPSTPSARARYMEKITAQSHQILPAAE